MWPDHDSIPLLCIKPMRCEVKMKPALNVWVKKVCCSMLCHVKHKFKKNCTKIIQKAIIFQSSTQQAYLITLEILYYEKDRETVLFVISLLKSLTQTIANPQNEQVFWKHKNADLNTITWHKWPIQIQIHLPKISWRRIMETVNRN